MLNAKYNIRHNIFDERIPDTCTTFKYTRKVSHFVPQDEREDPDETPMQCLSTAFPAAAAQQQHTLAKQDAHSKHV